MIEIRTATEEDFAFLPDIESDAGTLFADFGVPEIAASSPSPADYYRKLPKESLILVATENARIVGFAVGSVVDDQAYLREVSVRRIHAKQGIGKRLVAGIIGWAVAQDFQTMTLTTFRDLPFNAPFYAKFGFQEFVPDTACPELRAIREKEKRNGLEVKPRVAMRFNLTDKKIVTL